MIVQRVEEGGVRGVWTMPDGGVAGSIVLAHGAGSNCEAPLLVRLAEAFAAGGWACLRVDLPFRQTKLHGPPFPGSAAKDRDGLRQAIDWVRTNRGGRVCLGGHSYGGRQSTMLAAEDSAVADALLVLAYPLHPPRKPGEMRTAHLPQLRTPVLFVQGSRDPFATLEELEGAISVIPARRRLLAIDEAGHDLTVRRKPADAAAVVQAFVEFLGDGGV